MTKLKPQTVNAYASVPIAMMAAGPMATKAWLALGNETARFAMSRVHRGLEAQRAMLSSKTPMDLVGEQIGFYHATSQDFANLSTRVMQVLADSAQQTAQEAVCSHSRKYDDIPL